MIYQAVAKRMLDYVNEGEELRVDTQEVKFHVVSPNGPGIDIMHIVMHARGERHQQFFYAFNQQGAHEVLVASVARWDGHERMLITLEQKSQELSGDSETRGTDCWLPKWRI